jgi:hypothetical protein
VLLGNPAKAKRTLVLLIIAIVASGRSRRRSRRIARTRRAFATMAQKTLLLSPATSNPTRLTAGDNS